MCGMVFYELRYDESEVARLYSGYRGQSYTAVRERLEPGYAAKNTLIGKNPTEIRNRQRFMQAVLAAGDIKPASILDWGGDRGDFVPETMRDAKVYIYDVSNMPTLPGMQAIARDDQYAPYDLVMCTHVMEHVSEPMQTMHRLASLTAPGGHVYVEVPMDMGFNEYCAAIFSKTSRNGLPKYQHEHINYYSRTPIVRMVDLAGLTLVSYRLRLIDFGWTRFATIGFLARKPLNGEEMLPVGANRIGELLNYLIVAIHRKIYRVIDRITGR
jgi:hypothetical protein